jgi:GMP synthase (glutamine-hydrolysing)
VPATVLILQHTDVCPPARVGRWLAEAGCTLRVVRCDLGEIPPRTLAGVDGLVVLGGAMGAYDDAAFGWLPSTKELLRQAVGSGLPSLAICLGHQLLAVAHGGLVARSPVGPQLGLLLVELTPAGRVDPLFSALPADAKVVHWNNDMVTRLPAGAAALSNTAGGVQAFRLANAWAVQFHPEVDVETLRRWADADVRDGLLEQTEVDRRLDDVAAADDCVIASWRPFTIGFARLMQESG